MVHNCKYRDRCPLAPVKPNSECYKTSYKECVVHLLNYIYRLKKENSQLSHRDSCIPLYERSDDYENEMG